MHAGYTGFNDLAPALQSLAAARAQAVVGVAGAPFVNDLGKTVAAFAAAKLPAVYVRREFVSAGGLASYGQDERLMLRRTAVLIDKLLKGAPAASLQTEAEHPLIVSVNLATAKTLGLTLAAAFLAKVEEKIG